MLVHHDGRTILELVLPIGPDPHPDLVFWVGATGFEPVTPCL